MNQTVYKQISSEKLQEYIERLESQNSMPQTTDCQKQANNFGISQMKRTLQRREREKEIAARPKKEKETSPSAPKMKFDEQYAQYCKLNNIKAHGITGEWVWQKYND